MKAPLIASGFVLLGINFAAVQKCPLVVVVENNGYAYSTPTHKQSAAKHFVDKAIGYGVLGLQADGNDVLATYDVSKTAVDHARAGRTWLLLLQPQGPCARLAPRSRATGTRACRGGCVPGVARPCVDLSDRPRDGDARSRPARERTVGPVRDSPGDGQHALRLVRGVAGRGQRRVRVPSDTRAVIARVDVRSRTAGPRRDGCRSGSPSTARPSTGTASGRRRGA